MAEPVRKNLRHQCFSIENLSSICLYVWKALTLMCFQTIIKRTVIPKKNTPPILFNGEILARIVFFRKAILIYIIISVFCVCVCVCLTLYRLGSWTWYKLKTGIIRTIRTWARDFWKKISRKMNSGQITGKKFTISMLFHSKNLVQFVFIFEKHFFLKILHNLLLILISNIC